MKTLTVQVFRFDPASGAETRLVPYTVTVNERPWPSRAPRDP